MELSVRSENGQVLRVDARGRINMAVLAEQQEAYLNFSRKRAMVARCYSTWPAWSLSIRPA